MRESLARRIALSAPLRRQLRELDAAITVERRRLAASAPHTGWPTDATAPVQPEDAAGTAPGDPDDAGDRIAAPGSGALAGLLADRERLAARIARVPFIDEFDLRYNNRVP